MLVGYTWGNIPGQSAVVETYESAWSWGPGGQLVVSAEAIYSGTLDSGNTPTNVLRKGLLLGRRTSDGQYTNYSPTATDGSEVAVAILPDSLPMVNFLDNSNQTKYFWLIVGGPVQATNIINLDNMARAQMASRFIFDDDFPGRQWFPFKRFSSKTQAASPYQVLSTDNNTLFDNVGATGAVTFTLPTLANGYFFGFRVQADQTVTVASSEGTNMVAFNNASASSVSFQTGGAKIGGCFWIYSNPGATKWIVENHSAGANTITVA